MQRTIEQIRILQKQHAKEVLAWSFEELQIAIGRGEVTDNEVQMWLLSRAFGARANTSELTEAIAALP